MHRTYERALRARLATCAWLVVLMACGSAALASTADLIVPGERIGDLPPIGTAGDAVREMDFDRTFDVPTGSGFQWRNAADQTVCMLYVGASTDTVTAVYVYAAPGNERFATAEGIGLTTSEADVLAMLGAPQDVSEFRDDRSLRYAMTDSTAGLTIVYKTGDRTAPFLIMVAVRCA